MKGRNLIDRDAEEALNLAGVQVEGQETIGSGYGNQVGHQTGSNGDAGLVFFVGAAVAVVRHNRRNSPGRVALDRIDHDEQFHQIIVDRDHFPFVVK